MQIKCIYCSWKIGKFEPTVCNPRPIKQKEPKASDYPKSGWSRLAKIDLLSGLVFG